MNSKKTTCESFAPNLDKTAFKVPSMFRVIRLRNFIWLPALVATFLFVSSRGTPHMLWSYETSASGGQKVSCYYLGQSSQRVGAVNGRCPFIRFLN